jgi:prepilin-type N-terminal cleavage/methylation domain-containing protein
MAMRPRQGFTLVELLVATGVFMIGFTAAFSLFLAAMRYRTLADDTIRLSLAASSLVEELSIGQAGNGTPLPPSDYVGGGKLPNIGNTSPDSLSPYPGVPGTWFTVETCSDLLGNASTDQTATLHLTLLVVVDTQTDPATTPLLDPSEVNRRLRLVTPAAGWRGTLTDDELIAIREQMVKRGLAMRVSAVVVRRPSWM